MSDDDPRTPGAFPGTVQPVVLVGGKSRRFGRDKLVEPWGGKLLVQHPIDALRGVFGARVKIVGECDPRIPPLSDGVIPDGHPGAGPIGGIVSALEFCETSVFILAGDMPRVDPADILHLCAAAQRAEGSAAVLAVAGRPHPCFGIYHPAALPILRKRLEAGERRLTGAIPDRLITPVAVNRASATNVNHRPDAQTIMD